MQFIGGEDKPRSKSNSRTRAGSNTPPRSMNGRRSQNRPIDTNPIAPSILNFSQLTKVDRDLHTQRLALKDGGGKKKSTIANKSSYDLIAV